MSQVIAILGLIATLAVAWGLDSWVNLLRKNAAVNFDPAPLLWGDLGRQLDNGRDVGLFRLVDAEARANPTLGKCGLLHRRHPVDHLCGTAIDDPRELEGVAAV